MKSQIRIHKKQRYMNKFVNYTKRNNRSTWSGILVSFLFLISGEAFSQSAIP
jgi:hypothetical protein